MRMLEVQTMVQCMKDPLKYFFRISLSEQATKFIEKLLSCISFPYDFRIVHNLV